MNQKKHIALFTYDLDYGGTERVVSRLANELSQYYKVTIVLLFNQVNYQVNNDINIIALANTKTSYNSKNPKKWIQYFSFFSKYRKVLTEENIDVSLSFLAIPNIINGYAKSKKPEIKTIISERCYPSKTYTSFFSKHLRKFLFKIYYNNNNLLFSNSKYINQDLKENFNVTVETKVVYNPIIHKKSDYSFNPNNSINFMVISIGRLVPVKNFQGIIKAVSKLNEDVRLNIFGNGELENKLNSLIKSLNSQQQIFINQSVNEILEELKKHHCFVLNSLTEGFPNALLEAMSVGLPVISTNCLTGPLELLNEDQPITIKTGTFVKAKYGLMVNTSDDEGLAKAITYFSEHESERKKFSELSFARAKDYNIATISNHIKDLIESL